MKMIPGKSVISLCIALALLALSGFARAEDSSIEVEMEVTARLVTLPGAPYFTAKGLGEIKYDAEGDGATIKNDTAPQMIFESEEPPADLDALTVIVTGTLGTTSKVDWSDYPRITLNGLSIHITAYDVPADEITSMSFPRKRESIRTSRDPRVRGDDPVDPILEMTISRINLSTDPLSVEGVESGGYVDTKKMEVQLAGEVVLPDSRFPPYDEYLAGEPIILELLTKIKNPFERK